MIVFSRDASCLPAKLKKLASLKQFLILNAFSHEPSLKQSKGDKEKNNCSEKNETIVKYSVLNENKQMFASRYKLYLPTEEELVKELRHEIELIRGESKLR